MQAIVIVFLYYLNGHFHHRSQWEITINLYEASGLHKLCHQKLSLNSVRLIHCAIKCHFSLQPQKGPYQNNPLS